MKRAETRITEALTIIESYGGFEGEHHKAWVLDQVVRILTGPGYPYWVKDYEAGDEGPHTYEWDTGIAP